jgi:hypothetical protein
VIDTLKLSLSDYSIAAGANIEVQPSSFNALTGEMSANYPLWHDGVGYVEGTRAFHNAENFNVTLKPVSPLEPQSIGCYVQFSVPKVADGSNYHPTDAAGTARAVGTIQRGLKEMGIKTNVKTALLSRVDAFKTVEAQEPYFAYHPVLAMLRGQRMAKRDYGTTFLWSNTQQEICVYDKLEEMRKRKVNVSGLAVNSIRFEHRMLKAKKVRDVLGMKSVSDLLDGYDHVRDTYHRVMEKQLFKGSVAQAQVMTVQSIEHQLESFRMRGDRYWFQSYLNAVAMDTLSPDVEALLQALANVSGDTKMVSKIRRQIDQLRLDASALRAVAPSRRTLGELYMELKSGVLGAR